MAKIKKGYIVLNEEDQITAYADTLEEAKEGVSEGEEIYEVTANWKVRASVKVESNSLDNIFG